jgi:hypothetical protein
MPASQRAAKSQAAEVIQASSPKPRIRPPIRPRPEPPTLRAAATGKRLRSTPANDEPRKKIPKALNATSEAAQTSRERYRLPPVGLPPSDGPSNAPIPAVNMTSFSLRGGLIDNRSARSAAASNSSVSSPSPSQSSELGSVASFTGRTGPRSALHAGSLELASVLEAVKRLLERYCYRESPFIASGEKMIDVSTE